MLDSDKPVAATGAQSLSHVRVIDLSRILAGPWATQTLADLGADVIKIESPDGGDGTRQWGPPFIDDQSSEQPDAAYFTACNRNKRSVCIDFSTSEGAHLVRKLVTDADVLVENFKLGGLQKYGLGYEDLKAINPRLVYCSITGFGSTGPYAARPGYDFLIQAMGGLMSITGTDDALPGGGPVKTGVAICDLFTGLYATVSILAALGHRDRTGQGQHIECSLLDSTVATLANQASNWLVGGMKPGRLGNDHPNIVPYKAYPTSDGHIIIACGNDAQFARLCKVLGQESLAQQPDYATNAMRVANRQQLDPVLVDLIGQHQRDDLLGMLEEAQVPCGPILDVDEVFTNEQVIAREMQLSLNRPDGTAIPGVAFPARLSETPASYRHAPPSLGNASEEVLSALADLDPEQLDKLIQAGIVR